MIYWEYKIRIDETKEVISVFGFYEGCIDYELSRRYGHTVFYTMIDCIPHSAKSWSWED